MKGAARWVGGIVAVTALVVYWSTMASGLTWQHAGADGGDLATAAYFLGVPHPPGYPLYVLLGHLFARLTLLAGEPASWLTFFSALCAAGAAGVIGGTMTRLGSPLAGLVSGLTAALGPTLWSQAVIVEVYALNALAVVLLMALALAARERPGLDGWIGLAWGLSCTTHLTSVLMLPLLLAVYGRRPRMGQLLAGCLVGLSPFLLLPLLAARGPVVNWGDPVTVGNWWWLVSGKLYRGYLFGLPASAWPGRLAALAQLAVAHFTLFGIVLIMVGGRALWQRDRTVLVALLVPAVAIVALALGYDTTDSFLLLIPAWLVGTMMLGWGCDALVASWPRLARLRWLALGVPLFLLLTNWGATRVAQNGEAVAFAQRVLAGAPQDAIIETRSDAHTFCLWYYHLVLGQRPDLTVVDREMAGEGWYQRMLAAQDARWPAGRLGRPACVVTLKGELDCE